jgi:predicted RecB family nuclease
MSFHSVESIDAHVLMALAKALTDDDLGTENYASMPEDLKAALTTLQAEERAEKTKKAAKVVMSVLKAGDEGIAANVEIIRRARAMEAEAKRAIEKITKAKVYANETSNYLPLARCSGRFFGPGVSNSFTDSVFFVPADWIPKKTSEGKAKTLGRTSR